MHNSIIENYEEVGYSIIRNVIDKSLVSEIKAHIEWLSKKHPSIHPEAFHHELLVNDPFIHKILNTKSILNVVETFLGPNIALFGAHYIAKKPFKGKGVGWHQDGSYWPLEPMNVISVWLAGTDSNKRNGCMRVIPGTHNYRLINSENMIEEDMEKFVLGSAIHPSQIDDSNAIDIELNAGDISIHNPYLIHGSNFNTSDEWRIGLTLRYIPTSTFVNREKWECVLLKGKAKKKVKNTYANRPTFCSSKHMDFKGSDLYR